jgi:hypothetical protein
LQQAYGLEEIEKVWFVEEAFFDSAIRHGEISEESPFS